MAKVQKVYPKECKEEAVKLVQSSGKSAAQVARDLGVSESAMYLWQKQRGQRRDQMPSQALDIKASWKKKTVV